MRAHLADGAIAYIGKSEFKQPARVGQRRLGASPLTPHFVNQLIGNQSKRHDLSLLFEFSRDCRINTVGEMFSRDRLRRRSRSARLKKQHPTCGEQLKTPQPGRHGDESENAGLFARLSLRTYI
jgi:hypothetical protein